MKAKRKSNSFWLHDVMVEAFVDVELNEDDLRDAGWVPAEETPDASLPLIAWHDEFHRGNFVWCQERPCWDVNHV